MYIAATPMDRRDRQTGRQKEGESPKPSIGQGNLPLKPSGKEPRDRAQKRDPPTPEAGIFTTVFIKATLSLGVQVISAIMVCDLILSQHW
jgi:hypothetical protein